MKEALAECDTLNLSRLEAAALEGMDGLESYLSLTPYADAIPALKAGLPPLINGGMTGLWR